MVRLPHHVLSELLPALNVGLHEVFVDPLLTYQGVDARQHERDVSAWPNRLPSRFNLGVDIVAEGSDVQEFSSV